MPVFLDALAESSLKNESDERNMLRASCWLLSCSVVCKRVSPDRAIQSVRLRPESSVVCQVRMDGFGKPAAAKLRGVVML